LWFIGAIVQFCPDFFPFKVSLLDESIARCLDDVVGIAFLWFDERVGEICSSHARIRGCVFQGSGTNHPEFNRSASTKTIALGQESQTAGHEGLIWFHWVVLLFLYAASDALGQCHCDTLFVAHSNHIGGCCSRR
jgi:hypothetical protein